MKRVVTSLILIPFALYTIYWAPHFFFAGVVVLMAVLCFYEYAGIVAAHGIAPPGAWGYAFGFAMFLEPAPVRMIAMGLMTVAMSVRDLAQALPRAAAAVLGAIYIFGSWRYAIDLRAISPNWILFALAINWVGDVAAFYVGRNFGRHKLAPRVSPAKSWEGAAASMIAAVAFAWAFRASLAPTLPEWHMVLIAVFGNVAGQLGDLVESAIKRGAGVKDSGSILPGHGGVLDRMDSTLFTLPVVYLLLQAR